MRLGMHVDAFAGDIGLPLANRSVNEVVFSAIGNDGTTFRPVARVRVLAPVARDLVVLGISPEGDAFHLAVARYEDEAPFRAGVYLCALSLLAFQGPNEYTGSALATVRMDEDLPAIPRPPADPFTGISRSSALTD